MRATTQRLAPSARVQRRWRSATWVAALWLAVQAAVAAGPEVQDALLAAIEARDVDAARAAVARGADLNAAGPFQRTPLHKAARGLDTRLLEWMLTQGANPNAPDGDGRTPLHFANDESAPVLLRHKADLRLTDRQGNTALHVAAEHARAQCRLLVQAGLPVNARNHAGLTPLHIAILAGKRHIVERLVELGADVNAKSTAEYAYKPLFVGWDVKGMETAVPAGVTPVALARLLHSKNRWVEGGLYEDLAQYLLSKGAVERKWWQLRD